jgi:hypothetical protein
MPAWRAYPSGFTTEINAVGRTVVDPMESIGHPGVAKATAINTTNSAFAYLKGIASQLGTADGTGAGAVNSRPPLFNDMLRVLGERSDPPATDTGSWSAISLLKGIAAGVGVPA